MSWLQTKVLGATTHEHRTDTGQSLHNMFTMCSKIRTKISISDAIQDRLLITLLEVYRDNANNHKSAS